MFLPWLNVTAQSVSELLWYLEVSPPSKDYTAKQVSFRPDIQPENGDSSARALPKSEQPPSLPPEVTIVKSPPPSLFALIIGINKYNDPDVPDLSGAVADANAVQQFLTSKVGVAKDRIVNLRDEEATREAIIKAIQSLANNSAISAQDPILIFYAGHGSEALPPLPSLKTSSANGKIQMLCPYDFASKGSNDRQGQGIFDLTLSKLLGDIAQSKSDNITVILDSCHSGSGTRTNEGDGMSISRGVELPTNYAISANVFGSEEKERASSIAFGYEKFGLNSHVLLAACTLGQTAKERQGRGVFTSAFLNLLEEEGTDKLTYKDIIMRLPDLSLQNPQCQGVNQDRILFNSKVASPYRHLYKLRATSQKKGTSEYTLEAGEAHGVTNGAEFAIYFDKKMSSFVGSVVAVDTNSFATRCSVIGAPFSLSESAYAVQTRVGEGQDLRLFIEANVALLDLFAKLGKEIQRTDAKNRSFRLLNNVGDKPDLAISISGDLVRFHVMEEICRKNGLTRMPFDDIRVKESSHLFSILRSAAHFYWHLHHSNKKGGALSQKVTLECFKLVPSKELTHDLNEILVPEPNGRNLNINGTITIDVDERVEYDYVEDSVKYGFEIKNTSSVSLYAALFYFDVSDLSIEQYYTPGTAANERVEFSLPPNGSLTIGFGDGGMQPRKYFLRKGQSVDVGFLKLYISTEYIDHSTIAQDSPFERSRATGVHDRPKSRQLWNTLTIPIIQRTSAEPDDGINSSGRSGGSLAEDQDTYFGVGFSDALIELDTAERVTVDQDRNTPWWHINILDAFMSAVRHVGRLFCI